MILSFDVGIQMLYIGGNLQLDIVLPKVVYKYKISAKRSSS
jgi:hypothetical protein